MVAGRFRIVAPIAQGTWSTIYHAYQTDLDRHVALKILKTSSRGDHTIVERFRREALFISQLNHANTIKVLDYGETSSGLLYIAMEYLEGRTLGQLIMDEERLPPERAYRLLVQICQSLSEVHSLGMLHRDLKPDNIFLCTRSSLSQNTYSTDFIKVLDFGIAKATRHIDGVDGAMEHLTSRGLLIGTPLYMAPEQVMEQELTPATDIYSLGHILYEMLTGLAPFDDGTEEPLQIIMRHIEDDIPPLPPELENHPLAAVIKRTSAKNPLERFPDAEALLSFLLVLPLAELNEDERLDLVTQPTIKALPDSSPPPRSSGLDTVHEEFKAFALENPERSDVYTQLLDHLERVHDEGRGRLVVLRGEAGIGKTVITTSLSQALIHRDPKALFVYHPYLDPGWSLRQGDVWAMAGTLLGAEAFAPESLSDSLREAIEAGFEGREEVFKTLQVFQEQRINPLLSSIEVLRSKRHELFVALSRPFQALASERTLVWILEELHEEDSITLAFLQHLLGLFEQTPLKLLIIATVNEEALTPSARRTRALVPLLTNPSKHVHIITLRGVQEDAAITQMSSELDHPLAPELALTLHRLTDGHPQFNLEALKHLHESEHLQLQGGTYRLADNLELEDLIPHRLVDLVQRRLQVHRYKAQSGALLRYTLESVALLGSESSHDTVLTFMTSLDETLNPDTLNLAIQEAIQLGYLQSNNGHLQFNLPQIQRMLLEQLDRTATHDGDSGDFARNRLGHAASFLLERHPDPSSMVLHHIVSLYVMAGRRDKAARCLRKAAHSAYYRFDLDTAIDTYLQALRHARRPSVESGQLAFVAPETDEELAVFLRLGECYAILGDMGLAQDYLTCALRGAQLASKSSLGASIRGQAMQLKGDLALLQGNSEAAAWHFVQARRAFEKVRQDQGIARSIIERARIHLLEGEPHEALDPLLEALVLAEFIEVIPIQIQALTALARTHLQLGDPRRALKDAQQALDLLQRENDASNIANLFIDLGEIQYVIGDLDQARIATQQAIAIKLRIGERLGLVRARTLSGQILAALGRLDEAHREIAQCVDHCVRYHDPIGAARARVLLSDLQAHQNRLKGVSLERVERQYRDILEALVEMDATEQICTVLIRLALLKASQNQRHHAMALLEEAMPGLKVDATHCQRAFKAVLAWLDGLRGEHVNAQSRLDEIIATSQTDRSTALLFLSCVLMSDLHVRQGDPSPSHGVIQLAYSQALLNGLLTEAAQCRLELQRCGAYGDDAAALMDPRALLLGQLVTLPLLPDKTNGD